MLYCPDYFEYFIASFDEELVQELTRPEFYYARDTINIVNEYVIGYSGLI